MPLQKQKLIDSYNKINKWRDSWDKNRIKVQRYKIVKKK